MRTCRIILSSMAGPALLYVSICIVNVTIAEKIIDNNMCDILNNVCPVIFVILRRNKRDAIENAYLSSCKVPSFLSIVIGT
jgi:hypothetical protein